MPAPVPTKTTDGSMRFHPLLGKTTFVTVGFTGSPSTSLCLQILCGIGKVAADTAPGAIQQCSIPPPPPLNHEQPTAVDIELRLCSAEREDKYISHVEINVM